MQTGEKADLISWKKHYERGDGFPDSYVWSVPGADGRHRVRHCFFAPGAREEGSAPGRAGKPADQSSGGAVQLAPWPVPAGLAQDSGTDGDRSGGHPDGGFGLSFFCKGRPVVCQEAGALIGYGQRMFLAVWPVPVSCWFMCVQSAQGGMRKEKT